MKKATVFLAVTALLLAGAMQVTAQTDWQKSHPRRTQVNSRLKRQDARIHQERKEGEINGAQAHQMHQQDHQIRHEERSMAHQNHGHITRSEKKALNQQENGVSRQIGH